MGNIRDVVGSPQEEVQMAVELLVEEAEVVQIHHSGPSLSRAEEEPVLLPVLVEVLPLLVVVLPVLFSPVLPDSLLLSLISASPRTRNDLLAVTDHFVLPFQG
jgi:hypothetical protein